MVSSKGDTRAHRLPKDTCRFGTDLKFADLQSVKSTKWINDFVASSSEHLVVNTDRYIFQMSALASMLSKGPQVRCTPHPMSVYAVCALMYCNNHLLSQIADCVHDMLACAVTWLWLQRVLSDTIPAFFSM